MSNLASVIRVPGSKVGHLPAWGRPWRSWTVCHRGNVEAAVDRAMSDDGPSPWVDPDDVDRPCGHCVATLFERRRTQDAQLVAMGIPGVCRRCGCTDDWTCLGGCAWANEDETLCTACVDDGSAP